MVLLGEIISLVLGTFIALLFVRFIVDWIQVFARSWTPRGPVLVILEGIYTITDPPIKALRKVPWQPVKRIEQHILAFARLDRGDHNGIVHAWLAMEWRRPVARDVEINADMDDFEAARIGNALVQPCVRARREHQRIGSAERRGDRRVRGGQVEREAPLVQPPDCRQTNCLGGVDCSPRHHGICQH